MDKEQENKRVKEYADARNIRKNLYLWLFSGFSFTALIILIDFILGIVPNWIRLVLFFLFSVFSYIFYKKWRYLSNLPIITAYTSDYPDGVVGSGNVVIRIGGDKIMDKIKRFFKEM